MTDRNSRVPLFATLASLAAGAVAFQVFEIRSGAEIPCFSSIVAFVVFFANLGALLAVWIHSNPRGHFPKGVLYFLVVLVAALGAFLLVISVCAAMGIG